MYLNNAVRRCQYVSDGQIILISWRYVSQIWKNEAACIVVSCNICSEIIDGVEWKFSDMVERCGLIMYKIEFEQQCGATSVNSLFHRLY